MHNSKTAFWITYVIVCAAICAFVYASFMGVKGVLEGIQQPNSSITARLVETLSAPGQQPELATWAALEFDALENRQSRADSMLETRTWLRFMSSSFGAILVMCGAIFILTRVKIDQFQLESNTDVWKVAIGTTSPGMVMVLAGTFLMTMPLSTKQEITIRDGNAYPPPFETQQRVTNQQDAACQAARENGDAELIEINCKNVEGNRDD